MKPEEFATALQRKFSAFGGRIIYDQTAKGEDFCEMVYPNEKQPIYPLTVTAYEDGALLSFGSLEDITGKRKLSLDETIQAIEDIVCDRIVFALCYDNKERQSDGKVSDRRIFALTGDADDMQVEYDKFIEQLKKPIGRWPRFLTPLKGVFVFTNFSGSVNFEMTR